jgi:hypothetical protein
MLNMWSISTRDVSKEEEIIVTRQIDVFTECYHVTNRFRGESDSLTRGMRMTCVFHVVIVIQIKEYYMRTTFSFFLKILNFRWGRMRQMRLLTGDASLQHLNVYLARSNWYQTFSFGKSKEEDVCIEGMYLSCPPPPPPHQQLRWRNKKPVPASGQWGNIAVHPSPPCGPFVSLPAV